MNRALTFFVLVFLAFGVAANAVIHVKLAHESDRERRTQMQLQALLKKYELAPWLNTKEVIIEEGAIPHSHPVLTLNTRHLNSDDELLSTFVHEQMHWFLSKHTQQANSAIRELRLLFPNMPVGYPAGSTDEDGNYEHLVVIYLEYQADKKLLGREKAERLMHFWATDHYTWIYSAVLSKESIIAKVIKKNRLLPEHASYSTKN